jgi:hypothetical protein
MGSTPRATPAPRAAREDTAAACVRWVVEEACNNGDLGVLDAVLAPPAEGAAAPGPGVASAPPLRPLLAAFRAAVPDARWTIVQQIAQGDTVVTRLVVQGTFSGPLLGLAPPGRSATLTGVAISRFVGGRLVELWLQADLLGLLEQLELLPPLDLARALAMAQVGRVGALLAGTPAPRAPPPDRGPRPEHDDDQGPGHAAWVEVVSHPTLRHRPWFPPGAVVRKEQGER